MVDLNANDVDHGDADHRRNRPVDGASPPNRLLSPRAVLLATRRISSAGWEGCAARTTPPPLHRTRSLHAAQQELPGLRREDRGARSTARRPQLASEHASTTGHDATVEVVFLARRIDPARRTRSSAARSTCRMLNRKTARVWSSQRERAEAAHGRRRRAMSGPGRPHREDHAGGWLDASGAVVAATMMGGAAVGRLGRQDPRPA